MGKKRNLQRESNLQRHSIAELHTDVSLPLRPANHQIKASQRLVCAALATCMLSATVSASILQVPSGLYPTIQSAIDDAIAGDEILVAPGIYPEKIDFLGKSITVRSAAGNNVTTIDATGLSDSAVKCINFEMANTILDGFTITGGTGNMGVALSGGGMLNISSSPTVKNCIFISNRAATEGGGMFNRNADPTVTDCSFFNNSAGRGGGMHNDMGSQPVLTRCRFQGNSSTVGAGMSNLGASPTIRDCTYFDNRASVGGAICNDIGSNPAILNCLFDQNSGATVGGAIANIDHSSPTIQACVFRGNSASEGGAIINDLDVIPNIRSCLFVGNTARRFGGAIMNLNNSTPQITHSTFVDNTANLGFVLEEDDSVSTIENSIFWNNPSIAFGGTNDPVVNYTIVQGGYVGGVGNIDIDPQFLDADGPDNDPMTQDDNNYQLACDSPAIDTGDPAFTALLNELDLNAMPRILGNDVDRGAYEFLPLTPGDFNNNSLVDLIDIARFNTCMSDSLPTRECLCVFDLDESGTITIDDFALFQTLLTGP